MNLYRQVRRVSEGGTKSRSFETIVWSGSAEEWVETYTHFGFQEPYSVMDRFERPVQGIGWVRIETPEWAMQPAPPKSLLGAIFGIISALLRGT